MFCVFTIRCIKPVFSPSPSQIEKSATDPDQLNLIFSSQGVPLDDEEALGGLEVVLRIFFASDARRDEFLQYVGRTQESLLQEFNTVMDEVSGPALQATWLYLLRKSSCCLCRCA